MEDRYNKVLKLIADSSNYYLFSVNQFQGMEITLNKFREITEPRILVTFKLIEQLVSFMMYDKGYVIINDNFIITEVTKEGKEIFEKQNIVGDKFYLNPVSCFTRCSQFFDIPLEMRQYLNLIRQCRNVFAHSVVEEEKYFDFVTDYMKSLYLFLYWFSNDYINENANFELKNKTLEIIKQAKINFYVLGTRLKNVDSHNIINNLFESEKEDKYVEYLEKQNKELLSKIVSLELNLNAANETINNLSKSLANMGEDIKKDLEILKTEAKEIKTKIDDLTEFVVNGKIEIQKSLEEAQKEKDIEEVERIINMFSDKVIFEITNGILKQSEIDNRYDLEKKQLIITFGEKNWDKLDKNSQDFLITGKVLYSKLVGSNKMDFSGVCLLITKAVDNELHKYIYNKFKSYLRNKYQNDLSKWPSFFKKTTCYGEFLISNNDFTLGSVMYFCCKNQIKNQNDYSILIDYCKNVLFNESDETKIDTNLQFISDSAERIRLDYRNPAAHINAINKIKADECMDYILDTTKVLIEFMKMFK